MISWIVAVIYCGVVSLGVCVRTLMNDVARHESGLEALRSRLADLEAKD